MPNCCHRSLVLQSNALCGVFSFVCTHRDYCSLVVCIHSGHCNPFVFAVFVMSPCRTVQRWHCSQCAVPRSKRLGTNHGEQHLPLWQLLQKLHSTCSTVRTACCYDCFSPALEHTRKLLPSCYAGLHVMHPAVPTALLLLAQPSRKFSCLCCCSRLDTAVFCCLLPCLQGDGEPGNAHQGDYKLLQQHNRMQTFCNSSGMRLSSGMSLATAAACGLATGCAVLTLLSKEQLYGPMAMNQAAACNTCAL
jgi:hypothetical protein